MPIIKKINKGKWRFAIVLNGVHLAYARSYKGAVLRSNQIYGQMKKKGYKGMK